MTLSVPEPGNLDQGALQAFVNGDGGAFGLEDFESTGTRYPRLKFDHANACFVDDMDEWSTPVLDVILLGVVKQRIMFDKEVRDTDMKPQCKSLDAKEGWPNFATDGEAVDMFPWTESGLNQQQLTAVGDKWSLSCEICPFSQWGGHGKGAKAPRCSETMSVPCMYWRDGQWIAAVITFQRSSIGAAKSYISRFAKGRVPLFSQMTRITLTPNKRGNVTYCTPKFETSGPTDSLSYGQYAEVFTDVQTFMRTQRDADNESDEAMSTLLTDNSWGSAAPASAPAAPTAPATPAPPAAAPSAPGAPPQAPPAPATAPPAPQATIPPPVAAPAPPPTVPPAPPMATPPPPPGPPGAPPVAPAPPAPVQAAPSAPVAPVPPAPAAPAQSPNAPGGVGPSDDWPFN